MTKIRLNCYGKKVIARRLRDGGIDFKCPVCKTKMVIGPEYLAWSKKEVRTKETMVCVLNECGFNFDIIHSSFMEQEPKPEEFYYDGQPLAAILKVWRTRHERRRNSN